MEEITGESNNQMNTIKISKRIVTATIGLLLLLSLGFTWLFLMKTVAVDPGEEVVLVDRPYIFSVFGEGVRKNPIKEGRVLIFNTTKAYAVSVVPVSQTVAIDDFSTSDSFLLDFESNIQYRVTDTVSLIDRFGPEWFKNNIQAQYLGIVRTAIKKHAMRLIMSDPQTAEAIDMEITEQTRRLVVENKLPIEIINITLGRAKPNSEVVAQMNRTAAEKERFNTLTAAKASEDQRAESEKARAVADNAYRNSLGMSTEQFVALQVAQTYANACMQGVNCTIINGSTPTLTLPLK